ncbi:MAG TPA: hypothetical protein P5202_04430 [Methanomassiliicoccales archaeon]|nr:hypothetical protein [Methanomassiliicoccales archaeon]HNX47481.1 hypothetical protein [Methanomassiliicoccales archaeon]HPR98224.1 hypothetical protein [Methanomassiliicoccales archaeon]HSA35795.1 hypothetical protein [Methanomassiliicoccales archaeon]
MLITLTVKNEAQGGHIHLAKVDMDGEKEIGSLHYENEEDKVWLLKVLMDGHPNVSLMGANEKAAGAPEGEYKPCCFFGAMIDAMYEAEQKKNTS